MTFTVGNVGARSGTAFIRADIHDRVASRTRPVRQMKAFTRIDLSPGETKTVTLAIAYDDLAIVTADGRWQVEPGIFDIWVNAGDDATLTGTFRVV